MNENNEDLQKAWYDLHKKLVNEIINFCNEHNIKNADEVGLHTNYLKCSIDANDWMGCTDSSLTLLDKNEKVILCSI